MPGAAKTASAFFATVLASIVLFYAFSQKYGFPDYVIQPLVRTNGVEDSVESVEMLQSLEDLPEMLQSLAIHSKGTNDSIAQTRPVVSSEEYVGQPVGEAMLDRSSPATTFGASAASAGFMIPWSIHQTAKSAPAQSSISMQNVRKLLEKNHGWTYAIMVDADGESLEFLRRNFASSTVAAFEQLKLGAAKSDFLRYCILYHYGGLYLDLDSEIDHSIVDDQMLLPGDELVLFYDQNFNIVQHTLLSAPGHPFMKQVIDEVVRRIQRRQPNVWLATGPHVFTDVFLSAATNSSVFGSKQSVPRERRRRIIKMNRRFMGGRLRREGDWHIKLKASNIEGNSYLGVGEKHYKLGEGPTPGLYA